MHSLNLACHFKRRGYVAVKDHTDTFMVSKRRSKCYKPRAILWLMSLTTCSRGSRPEVMRMQSTLRFHQNVYTPGPCCTKLTIDGNFAINGNYHGNLEFDWLLSPVTMVVTINDKFYATSPACLACSLQFQTHCFCWLSFKTSRFRKF